MFYILIITSTTITIITFTFTHSIYMTITIKQQTEYRVQDRQLREKKKDNIRDVRCQCDIIQILINHGPRGGGRARPPLSAHASPSRPQRHAKYANRASPAGCGLAPLRGNIATLASCVSLQAPHPHFTTNTRKTPPPPVLASPLPRHAERIIARHASSCASSSAPPTPTASATLAT